jgi:hypothetical protein
MHINWVTSDTNVKDETLMETKQSLDRFGGHKIDVLKEEKKSFSYPVAKYLTISTNFISAESLSDDRN